MRLRLTVNKPLLAKCKLLENYQPLIEEIKKSSKANITYKNNSILYEIGGLRVLFNENFSCTETYLQYLDDKYDSVCLTPTELFKDIEHYLDSGMTHEYKIKGYRVLVNNFHHAVILCLDDYLITGFGSHSTITKVYEENNMLGIGTSRSNYLINLYNFEYFRL